ncbi:phage tail tape measure protein [Virgibacillus ndiopensis]|uniref:phage tail tape measure protein n=1 Tax=Virgibacillus ndiopensis TaxID=2004408 RepID=UPI000C0780A8|nr:phage tail tape measure protein [Virgibacillus ndiopensis]
MATKEVGTLRTKLSWEDDNTTRSLQGFKRDLKGLRTEMNVAKSQGKEYTNSLKGLREQSDILSRKFKTQKQEVKELAKRYELSKKANGENAKATKNLADNYNNARAQMNRTETQLQKVTDNINEQINPWKKLGDNAKSAGDKMTTAGQNMMGFGRTATTHVTLPLLATGGAAFKAAMDFETAFTGVEKTVDGTDQQLQDLRTSIRDMAKEIPASTTEIAAVAEAAGQLGIKTEAIEGFTRTMVDLGVATNLTSDQAATTFARFANIVGMSQDDFDKLGSTVVDLGNNLATTESEITEMALRLAGAGEQIGLSESQILAFSGALSSVGINAEAGGSSFSRVMVDMANSVANTDEKLKGFAKVAGVSSKEFAKAFEQDASKALMMFISGLGKMSKEGGNTFGVLEDLGFSEIRVRDALLRASNASGVFTDALNIGSKAWEENTALTEEAEKRYATTESQLKIMWNRIKDVGITLGEALVPAVMDAIDAAEPLIEKIESGAQAFSDMTEEEQQTVLKMIALAAAVGPASMVLGGLTTTVGGVSKGIGGLTGLLGKKGGSGLLGKIGLMGLRGGPFGLAIAGVGALGLGIYNLTKDTERSLEETLKMIDTRKKEIDSTDKLISSYEKLRDKNKLSTDEVLRYMDIMDELKNAKSEDTIKSLTDEQQKLLKKSGLTNDEMEDFLGLNDKIIDKSPNTVDAISDQGNAYAGVVDELKKLNDAERKRLTGETQNALSSEIINQRDRLAEQKQLQEDLKGLEQTRDEKLQKLIEDQEALTGLSGHDYRIAKKLLDADREAYDNLLERIEEKKTSIEQNEKELGHFEELKDDYAQMVLYEQGIVAEKGKAVEKLKEEQDEIDTAREKLEKQHKAGELTTAEYEKQKGKLDEQQTKIDVATSKLEKMNDVAGMTIFKDLEINPNPTVSGLEDKLTSPIARRLLINPDPSISRIDADLSNPISKTLSIHRMVSGSPGYADGTDFHPGGDFIAGEEGWELGRKGNRWEILNFGMYNRPSGYEVFPHDESKRILSALNRLPGYAEGARAPGEAYRIVSQLSNQPQETGVVAGLLRELIGAVREGKIIQVDGRNLATIQEPHITKIQEFNHGRRKTFAT